MRRSPSCTCAPPPLTRICPPTTLRTPYPPWTLHAPCLQRCSPSVLFSDAALALAPPTSPLGALRPLCARSGQLGARLTELTTDQADYIGVAKGGPYKPATYRY